MARGGSLASPRGEAIGISGGRAHSKGFSLLLEAGGQTYQAEVGLEGVRIERVNTRKGGLWWDILWALRLPPRLHLPITLLFLGVFAYGFFVYEKQLFLAFLLSGVFAALAFRSDGSTRWHSLEHKSIWVLEGQPPQEPEALRKALEEAPAYHPRCGSVDMALTTIFAGLLSLFLPLSPALLLGVLFSEAVQKLALPPFVVRLVQWPFLSPPRREELEATARGLAELLSSLEQVPHEDEGLKPREEALGRE